MVLGASNDPVEKNRAFREKFGLTFPLLCDPGGKVLAAYGVLKPDGSSAARSTFLIGADGRILRVWEKVKVDGHVQEVLRALP